MKLPVWIIALLLALAAATAVGCGSTSSSAGSAKIDRTAYDRIANGMSADKVKAIAGEPQKTEQSTMPAGHSMGGMEMTEDMAMESWYYQGEKGWVRFDLTNGLVTGKSGY